MTYKIEMPRMKGCCARRLFTNDDVFPRLVASERPYRLHSFASVQNIVLPENRIRIIIDTYAILRFRGGLHFA